MLEGLKNIFGIGPSVDLGALIKNGAFILDVRTREEFASGHLKGSVNIPLDQIRVNLDELKKQNKVVITCCASGMRSGTAKAMLKHAGIEAHNGGSWSSLVKYV
ncbi:MAG TPA: rhodanese-like domain-containing protein [Bacteroidia bacterium]|jgi:rhodanese-related sulfurtransferase|nr:rhodanese-like domain-containing protein [Bacteroidia bacterium]